MGDLIKVVFDHGAFFQPFRLGGLPSTLVGMAPRLTVLLEFDEIWGGSMAATFANLHREAMLRLVPEKRDTPYHAIAKPQQNHLMFIWEPFCGKNQLHVSPVDELSEERFKRYLKALAGGNMRGYLSVMVFINDEGDLKGV